MFLEEGQQLFKADRGAVQQGANEAIILARINRSEPVN
jgi:hypothetical protein